MNIQKQIIVKTNNGEDIILQTGNIYSIRYETQSPKTKGVMKDATGQLKSIDFSSSRITLDCSTLYNAETHNFDLEGSGEEVIKSIAVVES